MPVVVLDGSKSVICQDCQSIPIYHDCSSILAEHHFKTNWRVMASWEGHHVCVDFSSNAEGTVVKICGKFSNHAFDPHI